MSSNINLDAKKATEIKLFSFSTPAILFEYFNQAFCAH